jgi:L-seryl-tRNA(Ser) seleniumtransferase
VDQLHDRASRIAERLAAAGFVAEVSASEAMIGGGTAPGQAIESRAVRLAPPYPGRLSDRDESALARGLRAGEPSIVPQVKRGAVVVDLRAVFPEEDDQIVAAFARLIVPVD